MRVAAPGMLAVLARSQGGKRWYCGQIQGDVANSIKVVKRAIKEGLYKGGRTPACYFSRHVSVSFVRIKRSAGSTDEPRHSAHVELWANVPAFRR